MIRPLIIGEPDRLEKYSRLISKSKFFDQPAITRATGTVADVLDTFIDHRADVVLITGFYPHFFELTTELIRNLKPVYFSENPHLDDQQWALLHKMVNESGSIMFPGLIGINHPVLEEFLDFRPGKLNINYKQSCLHKHSIPQLLTEAFSIVSVLSPMPVKKMNVNSNQGKVFTVDFSLLDHSEGKIEIIIDREPLHQIEISWSNNTFRFNLYEGYVENHHGTKFMSEPWNEEKLTFISLEKFALSVITQNLHSFDFDRYMLVCSLIRKLDLFLSF